MIIFPWKIATTLIKTLNFTGISIEARSYGKTFVGVVRYILDKPDRGFHAGDCGEGLEGVIVLESAHISDEDDTSALAQLAIGLKQERFQGATKMFVLDTQKMNKNWKVWVNVF